MSSMNVSQSDGLMTVQDMIDSAFDGHDRNVVNFKLLRTIFYILAKQLRVLDRRVEVSMSHYGSLRLSGTSNLIIDEVKMVAEVPTRRKSGGGSKYLPPSDALTGRNKSDKASYGASGSSVKLSTVDTTPSTKSMNSTVASGAGTMAPGTEPGSGSFGAPGTNTATSITGVIVPATSLDSKHHNIMGANSSSSSEPKYNKGLSKMTPGRILSEEDNLVDKQIATRSAVQPRASSRVEIRESRAPGAPPTVPLPPPPPPPAPVKEMRQEKILVVGEAGPDGRRLSNNVQLPVVTKDQFLQLRNEVIELQEKLLPVGRAALPENIELMKELRRGASLTNAMAALQLSARLEGTENTLTKMTEVVTGLAKRAGLYTPDDINLEVLYQNLDKPKDVVKHPKKSARVDTEDSPRHSKSPAKALQKRKSTLTDTSIPDNDMVTFKELTEILQEFKEDVEKNVGQLLTKNKITADNAIKMAGQVESKLTGFLSMGKKMEDLVTLVSNYTDKVTVLDTSLSSQMTNYQEQLTQMQHDLEAGIENMAEAVASAGGDTTAVSELNNHFTTLQVDLEQMLASQKGFQELEQLLTCDVQDLWRQVEFLKAAKSDREEVEDALRDKAGIEALNGLVTLDQFEAVRADLEQRIAAAYNLFNNQEIIWQKLIDDVLRALSEKADYVQVVSLQDSLRSNCENIQKRLDYMLEIVGEPTAAATTRIIHRNAQCISCASPAHMNLEETAIFALPALRPPTIGAEAQTKPKDSGDHTLLCYPGKKISHSVDARVKYCRRYCGGSHTVVPNNLAYMPQSMIINPLSKEPETAVGTDGKVYRIDDILVAPCKPCNIAEGLPDEPFAMEPDEQAKIPNDNNGNMTPSDYRQLTTPQNAGAESITPTPPMQEE